MKQFIVLCSTLLLGVAIFNMIMGEDEQSVFNTMKGLWANEIQLRTEYP